MGTGFNTAYKETKRQDHKKGNEHGIVIGTVSSESDDGRKGELLVVDGTDAVERETKQSSSPRRQVLRDVFPPSAP